VGNIFLFNPPGIRLTAHRLRPTIFPSVPIRIQSAGTAFFFLHGLITRQLDGWIAEDFETISGHSHPTIRANP